MGFLGFGSKSNRNNGSLNDESSATQLININNIFDKDYRSISDLQSFTDNTINTISNDVSDVKFKHIITHEPDKNGYVQKEVLNEKNDKLTRLLNINGNKYTTAKGLLKETVAKLLNTNYALWIISYDDNNDMQFELASGIYDPLYSERANDNNYYYYQIKYDGSLPFNYYNIPNDQRGDMKSVPVNDALLFKNPRPVSDSTYENLNFALSSSINSMVKGLSKPKIQAFIKGSTNIIDKDMATKHANDMKNKVNSSVEGISYLQAGQDIQTINRDLKSIAPEDFESIKQLLYNSYGVNEDIINGTADEKTNKNYYQKVVGSILNYIVQEMNKKLFTDEEILEGHEILPTFNTYQFSPLSDQTNFIDKMIYNGVMSPNEAREMLNLEPYEDGDIKQTNANAIPMQLVAQPQKDDNKKDDGEK